MLTASSKLSTPRDRKVQGTARSRDVAIGPIAQIVAHETMLDELQEHSRRHAYQLGGLAHAGLGRSRSSTLTAPAKLVPSHSSEAQGVKTPRKFTTNPVAQNVAPEGVLNGADEPGRRRGCKPGGRSRAGATLTSSSISTLPCKNLLLHDRHVRAVHSSQETTCGSIRHKVVTSEVDKHDFSCTWAYRQQRVRLVPTASSGATAGMLATARSRRCRPRPKEGHEGLRRYASRG